MLGAPAGRRRGDVYEEQEPAVLGRMREIVAEVERNPRHVWHEKLGDLTANAFVDAAQADVVPEFV